ITPLAGCCSVAIACRRACRSPFLASVISFSSSGLTALALASVVLMRSWSMTSTHRLASRALRCDASRESLCRVFWWRTGGRRFYLVGPQRQTALGQGLDDLVDRLLAEVRDRRQLALGLRDEVAHGLDARALEAVVGADAELELLDQDVVHRAAARAPAGRGKRARAGTRAVVERRHAARARAQVLDAVRVGEDGERGDQDLRGLAQRRRRVD